jgi:hypothetical protein
VGSERAVLVNNRWLWLFRKVGGAGVAGGGFGLVGPTRGGLR